MATTVTSPQAGNPNDSPVDEFIVSLPDGVTVEALETSLGAGDKTPPAETPTLAPAPAPAPVAVAPPVAAPPVVTPPAEAVKPKPKGILGELIVTRKERQRLAAQAQALELENQRLTGELRQKADEARRQVTPVPKIEIKPEEIQRLSEEAETKARNIGEAVTLGVQFAIGKMNGALEEVNRARRTDVDRTVPDRQAERQAREDTWRAEMVSKGIDVDAVFRRAGIFRDIEKDAQGNPRGPATFQKIATADNAAAAAWDIAIGRLIASGEIEDEADLQPTASAPAPAAPAPTPSAAPVAAPAAAAPAPAAVTGTQPGGTNGAPAVTPRSVASERGVGIRRVAAAGGPPRVGMSREALDKLMYSDYDAYLRMCEQNPGLEAYHMEGVEFRGATA